MFTMCTKKGKLSPGTEKTILSLFVLPRRRRGAGRGTPTREAEQQGHHEQP